MHFYSFLYKVDIYFTDTRKKWRDSNRIFFKWRDSNCIFKKIGGTLIAFFLNGSTLTAYFLMAGNMFSSNSFLIKAHEEGDLLVCESFRRNVLRLISVSCELVLNLALAPS
jgi:hypothetical protein